jgi:predicted 3-demethylubiquinone-9 3-methyltransferase (glyoxalase superfamily)
MTPSPIIPCLWFDDQAEAAAEFYVSAFRGGSVDAVVHYPESAPNPSGRPPGSVVTVDFTVAGQRFTALNGGPAFAINPSISFFVFRPTAVEVDGLVPALLDGGSALMALDAYPWSERYAWVMDRFGVSWQVMAAAGVEQVTVAPCPMFTGPQHGRAREAIDAYVAAFPGSGVEFVDAYDGDGGPAGTVKHGRFSLAGQPLVAMDSAFEHGFTFNEAVSLQVMCADQAEVDRLWATLAEGGEFGPCGWLKDRFGVSWQVVPEGLLPLLTGSDAVARDRTFAALLEMGKLDLAELRLAHGGG